ncbi:hypothetical protein C7S16_1285 [Burkholderia thailandensis]|uniref:Uncharacterized protein n=1 Tax=Burkholderia thailandensis TaxID=57975 RepID=A0AAW9CXM0_BURTH|nr:hypothetical protein AQ476_17670 [Burkholderia thailandensis]MDW9238520.1 hypothetical protein [Burkholderia thailandensis]MDW9255653.1 hypothetical protein [Burkholderia thailandensis]
MTPVAAAGKIPRPAALDAPRAVSFPAYASEPACTAGALHPADFEKKRASTRFLIARTQAARRLRDANGGHRALVAHALRPRYRTAKPPIDVPG